MGHSLSEVKATLKPEELPEDDGIPMDKVSISLHIEEGHLRGWVTEFFDQLPVRDSFRSRTDYDIQDPAGCPNGLTHETYVDFLQSTVQVLEKRQWVVLKRLVRQHRGEWSFFCLRDWCPGRR